MLQTFLTLLSDGISAVTGWLDTLGKETIGVSLLGVMISFVTLYTIIRFLLLPSAFGGAGSDASQKIRLQIPNDSRSLTKR
jgi:hypothetical protein